MFRPASGYEPRALRTHSVPTARTARELPEALESREKDRAHFSPKRWAHSSYG